MQILRSLDSRWSLEMTESIGNIMNEKFDAMQNRDFGKEFESLLGDNKYNNFIETIRKREHWSLSLVRNVPKILESEGAKHLLKFSEDLRTVLDDRVHITPEDSERFDKFTYMGVETEEELNFAKEYIDKIDKAIEILSNEYHYDFREDMRK